MTVKARVLQDGEYLDIEIHRDGSVDITNKDMDYELAFSAMGSDNTAAVRLKRLIECEATSWLLRAFDFRTEYTGPDKPYHVPDFDTKVMETFAVDVVEHIVGIYEEHTKRTDIRNAIREARRVIREGRKILDDEDIVQTMLERFERVRSYDVSHAVNYARRSARNMLVSIIFGEYLQSDFKGAVLDTRNTASAVVAWDADPGRGRVFEEAFREDGLWQLRRLLHLIESRQEGKPLPGLEATP
jgi:hypothetical protein